LFAWKQENLTVFGNGLEAFRNDLGATGHSFLVDVVYNFGLLGTLLFATWIATVVIQHRSLNAYYMALFAGLLLIFGTSNAFLHPGFIAVLAISFGALRKHAGVTRD